MGPKHRGRLFGNNKWGGGCESKDLILYTGGSQSIEGGSLVKQSGIGKPWKEWIDYGPCGTKGKNLNGTTRDTKWDQKEFHGRNGLTMARVGLREKA
jgi:hypothetical protein